ncbi:zinc finger protein 2 homolog [Hermetia illucens]|uniref:zinc finger protein 2 homolog n=1 Tax=Hermetia illucens TaxID=343691 RepID=UPI0018CC43B5|nr:zinc finger protein 2 homolog [Hermetia illucens]
MEVPETVRTTCRTCAVQKDSETFTPLFAGPTSCQRAREDVLAELYAFSLKISEDDGLPQQICSACLDNFNFIVQFRDHCREAQDVLEAIYVRNDKNTIDVKVLQEYDDNFVKAEPELIKLEEIPANSTKIEEINVDAQFYEDEDRWESEYLMTDTPINNGHDGSEKTSSKESSLNTRKAQDSDSDSDDIPLKDYMKGVTKVKKATKKTRSPTKEGKDSPDSKQKEVTPKPTFPCNHCGKPCKSLSTLSRHIRVCSERSELPCSICTVAFQSRELLDKHMTDAHPNGGEPMCPICSKTFASTSNRDSHIATAHNTEKEYHCDLCEKSFRTNIYLKYHKTRHHQDCENECSICHQKFSNWNKYRYHWTHAHPENMKFKCKYCEKPFATQFVMRVHERSHTGERPFLCNQCGVAFRYRTQFLDHMKTHESKRDIACDMCGLTFYTNRQLSNHKRKHMSKNHACEICGEAFAYKLDLYAHKYNEHKIAEYNPKRKTNYPFNCPKCSKGFSVLTSLSKHIKIHTDTERKHVCPHCGNGYKRSDHLKLHIKRMHLKITEHKCEVCGREYLEKCALRAHMVVHDSARPFTCTKCPASFKRQRSLKDHMLKHEGRKEYACGICDMRFFNRTIVVLHTQRVHSDSQKQFMSELVRKELEEATSRIDSNEPSEEMKDDLINV